MKNDKATHILVLIPVVLAQAPASDGKIQSRSSAAYSDGWDKVFGKKASAAN